jgi:hypothetical protein
MGSPRPSSEERGNPLDVLAWTPVGPGHPGRAPRTTGRTRSRLSTRRSPPSTPTTDRQAHDHPRAASPKDDGPTEPPTRCWQQRESLVRQPRSPASKAVRARAGMGSTGSGESREALPAPEPAILVRSPGHLVAPGTTRLRQLARSRRAIVVLELLVFRPSSNTLRVHADYGRVVRARGILSALCGCFPPA